MPEKPLRVAQVIESIGVTAGGTSTAFLSTLQALRTLGPGVSAHAYTSSPPAGDPAWEAINADPKMWTLTEGTGTGLTSGALGQAIVADIRAGKVDLAHLHGVWSPDLMAAAKACGRSRVPYFWQPHGMLVREAYAQKRWKKELFMALGLRRALCGAAGLIFVTAEERDHSVLPGTIGPDRRQVVPLAVTMPKEPITTSYRLAARARFGLPADVPVVVFMGRFHHVKRVGMAVSALAALDGDLATTRLLLAGGGELEADIRAQAAAVGMSERVVFAGWVRGEDKWKALAAGDVLTLNSVHENFGYVAAEALCVGTRPVLTSNLAMAKEIPIEGAMMVVAEPTSAGLAKALTAALRGRDAMDTLTRGQRWVRENLSSETVGARLGEVYRRAGKRERA